MKYYTSVVPTSLYSKLLEKGMPENCVTYVDVFHWLLSKGVCICIFPDKGSINGDDLWRYTCYGKQNFVSAKAKGWIKTADESIRCAIEQLI